MPETSPCPAGRPALRRRPSRGRCSRACLPRPPSRAGCARRLRRRGTRPRRSAASRGRCRPAPDRERRCRGDLDRADPRRGRAQRPQPVRVGLGRDHACPRHAGGEHEPVPGPFREVVAEQLRDREDGTGHPRRIGHRRDLGGGLRRLLGARDPQDHLAVAGSQQPRRAAVAQAAQTVTSVSRTADAQSTASASGYAMTRSLAASLACNLMLRSFRADRVAIRTEQNEVQINGVWYRPAGTGQDRPDQDEKRSLILG
jgi:hypothetical protein